MGQDTPLVGKPTTLTFANQKGGSGKSLAAYFFADILAERGERVLVVDCDGQSGNLSGDLGADVSCGASSLAGYLLARLDGSAAALAEYVQHLESLDVLAGTEQLNAVDLKLKLNPEGGFFLRDGLDSVRGAYDHVIVDTPGDFNLLSLNALMATDRVLIPCHADASGIKGAKTILESCEQVNGIRRRMGGRLEVVGIFLNDFNAQANVHRDMASTISAFCEASGVRLLGTRVRHSVKAIELTTFGKRAGELLPGTVRRGLVRDMYDLVEEYLSLEGDLGDGAR